MRLDTPSQFSLGFAFGVTLRDHFKLVMGGRDPEIDRRLLGGAVLRLFEAHGWELYVVGGEVEIRPLARCEVGPIGPLELRVYARGVASALRAEILTGLAPYTCPRCDVRATSIPGLLCEACQVEDAHDAP